MAAATRIESSDCWNFSSTPGMLPQSVRQQLAEELTGSGNCLPLHTYHRTEEFARLKQQLQDKIRSLCGLPPDCHILLLSGGASMQFSMIPLNACRAGEQALYINTGYWSRRAAAAAVRLGVKVREYVPEKKTVFPLPATIVEQASYVFYVDNETADGVEFPCRPVAGCDNLVADMSSNFMSRPFAFTDHAAVFAGAQKNLGIAGLTVVVLAADRAWSAPATTPELLDYSVQIKAGSLYNTPVLMAWYVAKLVLDWIFAQGGLEAMAARNSSKSQLLYDAIDTSQFYQTVAEPGMRSRMNVTFKLQDPALLPRFIAAAEAAGLHGLAGHRHIGGVRAALYNAMPLRGVEILTSFMREFERRYG